MKFKIQITETLQKIIEVEAKDEDAAYDEAEVLWGDGDVVLDSEDFKDVNYEVVE